MVTGRWGLMWAEGLKCAVCAGSDVMCSCLFSLLAGVAFQTCPRDFKTYCETYSAFFYLFFLTYFSTNFRSTVVLLNQLYPTQTPKLVVTEMFHGLSRFTVC